MINFKQGDLVQLKNDGDKKDIYSIGGAYKQSSDEYTYELPTLNGRYLEDDYTNSDLVKYDFTVEDKELNERLKFDYMKVIKNLDECKLIVDKFEREQKEMIKRIVSKYSYECVYASNIFDIIDETANRNNQTKIEFTSKYVPYILRTLDNLKSKYTHKTTEDFINDGLMMHLYYTMEQNRATLYKRMLLNDIIHHLDEIQEIDIFGYINNLDRYTGDYANVFLTINPNEVLEYLDEYLKEMIDIPLTEVNKTEKKLQGFYSFLKEKTK